MSFLGLSSSTNYSIAALPVYYGICLLPHFYAAMTATQAAQWDNRNPRAQGLQENLRQRMDATTFGKYERAEAAHFNGLESFPQVATAVIAGNMARLDKADLNTFVAGVGLLRVLYNVVYISTERQKYTPIRSAIWFTGLGWILSVMVQAGRALM